MHTYEIEVYRDGRWHMIRIPELDGLTQARHPDEIPVPRTTVFAARSGYLGQESRCGTSMGPDTAKSSELITHTRGLP